MTTTWTNPWARTVPDLFERSRRGVTTRIEASESGERTRFSAELRREGETLLAKFGLATRAEAEQAAREFLAWLEGDDPSPPAGCCVLFGRGEERDGRGPARMFLIADQKERASDGGGQ